MLGRATRPLRAIHRVTGVVGLPASDTAREELIEVYAQLLQAVKVTTLLHQANLLTIMLVYEGCTRRGCVPQERRANHRIQTRYH
jgi:hypothetical protein